MKTETVDPDDSVNVVCEQSDATIAFGSCNRQIKPQGHWDIIKSYHPSHFFWLGDSVYDKGGTVETLRKAYKNLTDNVKYSDFKKCTVVDGIWDDHDRGVNDGGKYVDYRSERQHEFVNFMAEKSNHYESLRWQHGLYHSTDVPLGNSGLTAKFIFLDTRSARDPHWLPSLAEYRIKGSAFAASALRAGYTLMALGRNYPGLMLGYNQWKWLEKTLLSSQADVNVLVSSVQVLTTNPVIESWGHFPVEKQRLLELLKRTDPKGLILLSGDVHMAEISKATYTRADGTMGEWVEITSSGLTHTCADGLINKFLCPLMTTVFAGHRHSPNALYMGKNFGLVKTTPVVEAEQQLVPPLWNVTFSIQSLQGNYSGAHTVLSYSLIVNHSTGSNLTKPPPIVDVQSLRLTQLPEWARRLVWIALVAVLYMWIIARKMKYKEMKASRKRRKRSKID